MSLKLRIASEVMTSYSCNDCTKPIKQGQSVVTVTHMDASSRQTAAYVHMSCLGRAVDLMRDSVLAVDPDAASESVRRLGDICGS